MKNMFENNKLLLIITVVCAAFAVILAAVLGVIAVVGGQSPDEPEAPAEDTLNIMDSMEPVNGVWIASVFNIDYPTKTDLSEAELKAELNSIVANVKDIGLNTIFFQVRPESDALYKSDIYPVSKYLSSDGNLILDPLEYIIKTAHNEGIKVHAWINPVRVTSKSDVTVADLANGNPAKEHSEYTVTYADGKIYYDLGIPEVRELICEGVEEIVTNYDVDGIVFDDYFYPYPVYTENEDGERIVSDFNDRETYSKYNSNNLDIADWRRANVNLLIKGVYETVKSIDENCLFGVSPFGIWKNGYGDLSGSLTSGSQSYSELYCDSIAWIKGGFVDYIAPQLYWTADQANASYNALCDWWADRVEGTKVRLLICHGAYRYENDWEAPGGNMKSQVEYAAKKEFYRGSLFYGYSAISKNINGVGDELKEIYGDQD